MTRVKIVRCYLRSPGEAPTVRFIPLREYDLWKYFMTHRHGKIVEHGQTSVWVEAETLGSASRETRPLEAVVRVDLQYWDGQNQTAALVERYFPLDEYILIRDVFLNHFPDDLAPNAQPTMKRRVREVKGYFVYQQDAD